MMAASVTTCRQGDGQDLYYNIRLPVVNFNLFNTSRRLQVVHDGRLRHEPWDGVRRTQGHRGA